MNLKPSRQKMICLLLSCLLLSLAAAASPALAQAILTVVDQTPEEPLAAPDRDDSAPRYLSTIGSGDSFTVFYEDRANASRIALVSTTGGPTAFPAADTDTTITDTHFLVKDWPITVGATEYAYRAWGAVGNNPNHNFYVSNNLTDWTLVSTFTIPNAAGFTDARGWVYYGFHDVIEINGTYYAFAEANSGETMIVRSAAGDDAWEAFDKVGGDNAADGPLQYTEAWTPTGSFFEMADGYGKLHMPGDDSGIFIAVNRAAIPGMPEDELEAAFINPDNWMWEDGTTGIPTTPLLAATAEHDYRECRLVPRASASDPALIMYTADYGSTDAATTAGTAGGRGRGLGDDEDDLGLDRAHLQRRRAAQADLPVTDGRRGEKTDVLAAGRAGDTVHSYLHAIRSSPHLIIHHRTYRSV